MRNVIIALLTVIVLVACNPDALVSESKGITGAWNKEEPITFTIPQMDSLKRYNVYLHIRNSNDYKFNNLFLLVSMRFPHGKTVTDTLEYRMANPDGTWIGEGIGSIKENKLIYKENIPFSEGGKYQVSIIHAVRNNGDAQGVSSLEGITDVGYSIEEFSQQ